MSKSTRTLSFSLLPFPLLLPGALLVLSACSGGSNNTVSDTGALTLVMNAGGDQTLDEGATGNLAATMSDADSSVAIEWSQVSGPMITFSATDVLSPQLSLPRVREDDRAVLRLTVSGAGATLTDDLTIYITNTVNGPSGGSSQGIRDRNRNNRRNRARDGREMVESREVRTYDGANNNIDNPLWGTSFSHLQRLGAASYSDGISSLAGEGRPSARAISNIVLNQEEGESLPNSFNRTDMVWQWGQFIDHDIDLTDGANEEANIPVPTGDPQFDPAGSGTAEIPFSRALFDASTGTSEENPREQENEITSWIDGSMIYGSDAERAAALTRRRRQSFSCNE